MRDNANLREGGKVKYYIREIAHYVRYLIVEATAIVLFLLIRLGLIMSKVQSTAIKRT